MSLVCIIEREPFITRQIQTALIEIDSKLTVVAFKDLDGFYKWFAAELRRINREPETPKEDLKLLIGDLQFLGPRYFTLIEKLRKLMARRGFISREDDLAVILTAFEAPNLNYKQIESRIINNLIFKPFDLPILKQHLQVALAQQQAIKDYMIFNQKLKTTAEMLKEVQLESFSEMGFTTRSNRELPLNAVSKYYFQHFENGAKTSVLARCLSCIPHPTVPDEYQAEFRYLGLNNGQVKKLRQSLFKADLEDKDKTKVSKVAFPKAKKPAPPAINFLMFLTSETDHCLEIKDNVESNLFGIGITLNRSMAKFMEALAKNDLTVLGAKPIHVVLLDIAYFNPTKGVDTWRKIQGQIEEFNKRLFVKDPKPRFFLLSSQEIPDVHLRNWASLFEDVLLLPIDRPYLNKRLLTLFSEAQPKRESLELLGCTTDEVFRVANPIELVTISEACLTMKYYRPISFHSFRRFFLPSAQAGDLNELLGSCYFVEKKDNFYINYFVFFGITDRYLKYIRKWILENYIASKEGAA
ncbi:MAG: hypothetical protein RJB66_702 [Pseudomonadota bacterium]|jgi:hypothetical protein